MKKHTSAKLLNLLFQMAFKNMAIEDLNGMNTAMKLQCALTLIASVT